MGDSLQARYERDRQEREVQALQEAARPYAPLSAVAGGFAAGAGLPLATAVVPWAGRLPSEMEAAKIHSRVEALLQSRGFSAERARASASDVIRMMQNTQPSSDVLDIISEAASTWHINAPNLKSTPFKSKDEALDVLSQMLGTDRATAEGLGVVGESAKKSFGGRMTSGEAQSVLHKAEQAFKDLGGVNPKWSTVAGSSLARTLKEAIPVAMVIGAGGAMARLAAQRRQKKTYEKLKTAAAKKRKAVPKQKEEALAPPQGPEIINGSKEQPLATAPVVTVTKTATAYRGEGVDPMNYEASGRRLAQYMWSELEKIAAATSSPSADMESQHGAMQGTVQQGAEGEEEATPSHGVVAARVEQLDDKKARGIPVIQPPPGFVFAPELQSFVPDESNPAWIQAEQAAEAAKNKSFYDQGQRDVQGQMVQEAATQQQAQAEAQVMQEQMQQQVEGAKKGPAGAKTPASVSGKPAAKKSGDKAGGKKPAAKKPGDKDSKKAPGDKGVTINIGSEKKAADSSSEAALAGSILTTHSLGAALGGAIGATEGRKGKAAVGAGAGDLGGRVAGILAAKGIAAAVGRKLGIKDADMLERAGNRLGGAVGAWNGAKLGKNKKASTEDRLRDPEYREKVLNAIRSLQETP